MLRKDIIPRKFFPPGYDYEQEQNIALALLGIGAGFSLQYYWKLYLAVEDLYIHRDGKILLIEDAIAQPFEALVSHHWVFYMPFFLFLFAMAVNHYLYYCSAGKCLYLMYRLPQKGALLKSCVQVPVFCMMAGTLLMEFLYLLYYIVYLLMIPGRCIP